jgi:hypothetical protein
MAKTQEQRIKDLRKQIDDKTEAALAECLKDLDYRIQCSIDKRIGDIVAQSMGFSNRWHEWEIDHCNGRATAIANAIGERAEMYLAEKMPNYLDEVIGKKVLPKGWKTAIRKEFDERLGWLLRDMVKNHADGIMQSTAEKLLEEALKAPPENSPKPKPEDEYEEVPA